MELNNKVVVVTGGASGIGRSLAERFYVEKTRALVIADQDADGALEVADRVEGVAVVCDVSDEESVADLVARTVKDYGTIDLMVSNAGYVTFGALEASDEELRKMFDVHVMAHLWAARYAIPHMIENGGGYFLNTASAAGLLTQLGSLHYSITKHAAISLAEFIAITYNDRDIRVSVLCPQAVDTNIISNSPNGSMSFQLTSNPAAIDGTLAPEELAETVVEALRDERFHILPHPEVAEYHRRKSEDIDRWLIGMNRLQQQTFEIGSTPADWLFS